MIRGSGLSSRHCRSFPHSWLSPEPPTDPPLLSDDACRVMTVCFYGYFKLLSEFASCVITLPPKIDYLYSFVFTFPLNYSMLLYDVCFFLDFCFVQVLPCLIVFRSFALVPFSWLSTRFDARGLSTRIWATSTSHSRCYYLTPSCCLRSTSATIFLNFGQPPQRQAK